MTGVLREKGQPGTKKKLGKTEFQISFHKLI